LALFKRGNVYWSYVWVNGVRHAKSTGSSNRRTAERIDQHFKEELNLAHVGIVEPKPEMTFSELAARFLAEGAPRPHHVDRLKLLLPYWGDVAIGRITKAGARDYRAHRHEVKKNLSETTVNRDLEVLRHILFWAVDEGLLLANPLSRVPMVRERRKPRIILTVTEEDKLLAAAAPHLRSIIIAALDSGMRRGEILSERWEHVDFTRRVLYVSHSKTPDGEGREIPLTARLFADLEARRKVSGFVFTFDNHPITRIKTAWKAALRRAGLRYIRFHDLRHAFNSRLGDLGVIADVRKALMGHSSGEDVNSLYTHVEIAARWRAIRKLERWTAAQRMAVKKKGNKESEHVAEAASDVHPDDMEEALPDR
jgi:integrase